MKKLATSKEIKTYETYLTESGMISSILLMERAALSVYDELLKRGLSSSEEVWVVCGHGNNGADGLAIARLLSEKIPSEKIHITLLGDEDKATEEWHMQRSFLKKREIEAYPYPDHLPVAVPDLIIDAVLGIGSDPQYSVNDQIGNGNGKMIRIRICLYFSFFKKRALHMPLFCCLVFVPQ